MPDSWAKALRPDDGLVRLHLVAGEPRHHPARARDLARVDARPQPVRRLAYAQQHHDLLERCIARPLADPVDRALHLAAPGHDARERVRHGQAQVVVAVHRAGHLGEARDEPVELAPHRRVLLGHRVADSVRHVDRGRALVERDLEHLGGELEVGAGGVHGRELASCFSWPMATRFAAVPAGVAMPPISGPNAVAIISARPKLLRPGCSAASRSRPTAERQQHRRHRHVGDPPRDERAHGQHAQEHAVRPRSDTLQDLVHEPRPEAGARERRRQQQHTDEERR